MPPPALPPDLRRLPSRPVRCYRMMSDGRTPPSRLRLIIQDSKLPGTARRSNETAPLFHRPKGSTPRRLRTVPSST
jgi:hypothetical protein